LKYSAEPTCEEPQYYDEDAGKYECDEGKETRHRKAF